MSEAAHCALFGQRPGEIYAPRTADEAREIVRASAGKAIIPWGGGTRQHVGHAPERYNIALSTAKFGRIVDYAPADLTVTCEAGVTVSQLQKTLAEHHQFLPLDIAEPDRQTVGGVIATRADSLRRAHFGSVRDSLLGVTVINARGEMVKGGGKVVKNVAGYDLPKLYCGSWGTLGLIVEATFKVSPLPEASATCVLPLNAERNSEEVLDALMGSELAPSFLCLLSPGAAAEIFEDDAAAQALAIGFDGDAEAVAWQVETLGAARLPESAAGTLRARLRDFSHADAPMTCAFHILSSQVGAFSRMLEWTARRANFTSQVVSDAALGLMRAHFSPARADADWLAFFADLSDKAARVGGSFVVERMPAILRQADTPVWSPLLPDWDLMARLKEKLDPEKMWNPGRFVGGI